MLCDFCEAEGASWWYLPLAEVGPDVEEGWIACDICHLLIEARDEKGLAERACENLYAGADLTDDEDREEAEIAVAEAQLGFWYQYDPRSGVQISQPTSPLT